MGEHYIEIWLSYDPITDFVPESNTPLFISAAARPRGSSLFSSGLMIYAPTPALAGV